MRRSNSLRWKSHSSVSSAQTRGEVQILRERGEHSEEIVLKSVAKFEFGCPSVQQSSKLTVAVAIGV